MYCGPIKEWQLRHSTVVMSGDGFEIHMTAIDTGVLKIDIHTDADTPKLPDAYLIQSARDPRPIQVHDDVDTLTILADGIRAQVRKSRFALNVFDDQGHLFFEQIGEMGIEQGESGIHITHALSQDERIYGLGEHVGALNLREQEFELWNMNSMLHTPSVRSMYESIPVFLGIREGKTFGCYFQHLGRVSFDLGRTSANLSRITIDSPPFTWYVMTGTASEILQSYTNITGRMPLPPKWALGYHQSRYSYETAERVLEIAKGLRERQIPGDAIHLDIHYMDGFRVFTWHPEHFPEPEKLLNELLDLGFHVVAIVDPGVKVEESYDVYVEGKANGHFVKLENGEEFHGVVWPGVTAFPNYFSEETQRWWGDLHKSLIETGVAGIWNDMNEPALRDDLVLPNVMDGCVHQLSDGTLLSHKTVHNAYALMEAKATYEGLRRLQPNERPFILTRSGFSGIQKYAAVWTGDNSSWWEHLAMAIPMCINLSLSGVPFVGTDIGGFMDDCTPELYARWVEVGSLFPFSRTHTALDTRDQEPWSFGPKVEAIARNYLSYRYQLLPYLYSLFAQSAKEGTPILRPIWWLDPADAIAQTVSDEFLLGNGLLAAPVITKDERCRAVYLPKGTWFDAWTGERLEGGHPILADAPLERMPLYVRAGAVLPTGPAMPYVGAIQPEALEIFVAPGDGEFLWYEDDGASFDYEQGQYVQRTIRVNQTERQLDVALAPAEGAFKPGFSSVIVHLGFVHQMPVSVAINNRPCNKVSATLIQSNHPVFAKSAPNLQDWTFVHDREDLWLRVPYTNEKIQIEIGF
ncbi:MAG: glycoside hydrolase family 31 protein [Desulfitobacteriaceae bacterium]